MFGPYYSCPSDPANSTPQIFPACDIYYNNNKTHDRQIAGFGEASYSLTDQFKLTLGARYAKLGFDLNHYADGYENYGPGTASGSHSEHAFTPKARPVLPGGRPTTCSTPPTPRASGPAASIRLWYPRAAPGPRRRRLSQRAAPLTYGPDNTQSYRDRLEEQLRQRVQDRDQRLLHQVEQHPAEHLHRRAIAALQFTDNLGTAVAKGFDMQTDVDARRRLHGRSRRATPTPASPRTSQAACALSTARRSPATRRSTTLRARVRRGPSRSVRSTSSSSSGHDAFVRLDWEYTSRNPWLAPVQDPATSRSTIRLFVHAARHEFHLAPRRHEVRRLADRGASATTCSTHITTTNYALAQLDDNNPCGPPTPQQNDFTFRPRTVGITD